MIQYTVVYRKTGRSVRIRGEQKDRRGPLSVEKEEASGTKETAGYEDVILSGEEERLQPVPPKPVGAGTAAGRSMNFDFGRLFDYISSYSRRSSSSWFFSDMKKYVNREGRPAPFVPYMDYWPTYDNMDKRQRAWYFYWRSEVRKGNYQDTDMGYVLIYVYELLNGVGWREAQNGYDQLMKLWMSYRERIPELDHYLFSWSFDFARLHGLEYSLPDIPDLQLTCQPAVRNLLIDQHREDRPLKLPFVLIEALCDYSIAGSRFYQDGHQLLMQEAIPRVVALADAALLKTKKRGILALYGPKRTRKQAYYAFENAVCFNADKRIDVAVRAYTSSQSLCGYINELVRYGENVLRKIYGCRGRLRGVTLNEEMAGLIETFLKREYTPAKEVTDPPIHKVEISLDFDSIDMLRAQSDAVRDALDVPEEAESAPAYPKDLEISSLTAGSDRPDAADYNAVSAAAQGVAGAETQGAAGAEAQGAAEERDKAAEERDKAAEERDKAAEERDKAEDGCFELSVLSPELCRLINELTAVQRKVLSVLLSDRDVQTGLEQLAEEAMTMPDILIDEINETAAQVLDDILIDVPGGEPCILEQYGPELKKAWRREES